VLAVDLLHSLRPCVQRRPTCTRSEESGSRSDSGLTPRLTKRGIPHRPASGAMSARFATLRRDVISHRSSMLLATRAAPPIDSPVAESGKTTVIEHLQRLCLRGVQIASLASPALLTRMLDIERRTILIDEADRSLNPDKEGIADLMSIINTGYKRGATRPVLVPGGNNRWEVAEMPTFAAVAMAGNNPNLPAPTGQDSPTASSADSARNGHHSSAWLLQLAATGPTGSTRWRSRTRRRTR
jgi:hypothetical protein